MFCPYIKNKEVRDGFNEMVEAFGGQPMTEEEFKSSPLRNQRTGLDLSAMELAYDVYNANNGHFIDKTPTGELSKLFDKLLLITGSRSAAMLLKSRIYSDTFKNIYGDISELGEPEYEKLFRQTDKSISKIHQDFKLVCIDLFLKPSDGQLTSDVVLKKLLNIGVISSHLKPLLDVLGMHQVPIVLAKTSDARFMATRTDQEGNSYIIIDPQKVIAVSNQYFAEKLLHELSHVVTVPIIDNPKSSRQKKFSKLVHTVHKQLVNLFYVNGLMLDYSYSLHYALLSPKEFVAEFLVNEDVRRAVYNRIILANNNSIISNIKEFINTITRAIVNQNLFDTNLSLIKLLEKQLKDVLYNKGKIEYENSNIQLMFDEAYDAIRESTAEVEDYDTAVDRFLTSISDFLTNYAPTEENYSRSAIAKVDAIFKEIQGQLETRLKALERVSSKDSSKNEAYTWTNDQIIIAQSATMSPAEKIKTLIQPILPQLQADFDMLKRSLDNHEVISADEYNYLLHDNAAVYQSILQKVKKIIKTDANGVESGLKKELGEDGYNTLVQFVDKAASVAEDCVGVLEEQKILIGKKAMQDYGKEVGGSDLIEAAETIGNAPEKDTSLFIMYLGALSAANNKILNFISGKITKAINVAARANKKVGNKMMLLLANLKFGEKVTDLYERLADGSFTQNLIRKVNFGQLEHDYNEFMSELLKKYELSDSELEYGPQDPELRKKFFSEKNKWIEDHAIRRYQAKYYEAFSKLSPLTQAARKEIQAKINEYRRMCTDKDTNRPDYSKLTDKLWDELQKLYQQKKMLASIYDAFGNVKTGELLQIALEILQLNKDLYGDSTSRRSNVQAWLEDREKIIEQCGGRQKYESKAEDFDFETLERWDRRNSRSVLKFDKQAGKTLLEMYIDKMAGEIVYEVVTKDGSDGGELYRKNNEKKNALLAPYRNNFGEIGMFDSRYGDVIPKSVIAQVSAIDREQAVIRKLAKKRASRTGDKQFLDTLAKRKELREKIVTQGVSKAYKELCSYYRSLFLDNPEMAEELINNKTRKKIFNFSDGGEMLYGGLYQWYTKTVINPEFAEMFLELVPNDNYLDDTVKSDLIDTRFDEWADQGEYMIPRTDTEELKKRYDNSENFKKVDKKTKDPKKFSQTLCDLYEYSVEVIKLSNERYKLPNRSNYLLPGITASNLDTLVHRKNYKTIRALRYIKKNWFGLREREDTDLFGEKIQQELETGKSKGRQVLLRPDGTELRMIPKYYHNKLLDRFAVSRDLSEILVRYDKQSRLFEERSKILGEMLVMLDIIASQGKPKEDNDKSKTQGTSQDETAQNETIATSGNNASSNTYKAAKKHIETHLYDIKSTTNPNLARLASLAAGLVSAMNLGFNAAVAATGYFTTSTAHLVNALTGYKYGIKDVLVATNECAKYALRSIFGFRDFANKNSKNKQIKLMEYFDISNQYEGKIKNSSDAYLIKLAKENVIWGMLKYQDSAVKMSIMIATLNSYRLVNGEFVTKEDIKRRYWNNEFLREKMLGEYAAADSLYDLLYVDKEGNIAIDKAYLGIYDKVFDAVYNRVQQYSENADGMATRSQKSSITTGFFGTAVLMHRQYFPLMLQERYGHTVYNPETRQYQNGIFRNAANLIFNSYLNMFLTIAGKKLGETQWSAGAALNCAMICGTLTFQFGMPIFFATSLFSAIAGAMNGEYYNQHFAAHKNASSDEKAAQLSITRLYQLKQMRAELLITQLLIYPIATLITALADSDEDKDDKFILFAAYISARVLWETFNPYRFADASQQVKSVTAMTSAMDKFQVLVNEVSKTIMPRMDALYNTLLPWLFNLTKDDNNQTSEDSEDGVIFTSTKNKKSGVYSYPIPIISDMYELDTYFTKLGLAILNLTPFVNTYKQALNSKRSRLYYRNQIMQDSEYKEEPIYQYFDSELVDPINDYLHNEDYDN